METTKIKYDEISDTLTIVFESGKLSIGIELTNNILLRIDSQTRQAVSLNFFDYSILFQTTDLGSRSFPLTELSSLSKDLQDTTLQILRSKPVCDFLQLSAYTPSITKTIPIVVLHPIIAKTNTAA
jgi:uncharacterized protein YuzE